MKNKAERELGHKKPKNKPKNHKFKLSAAEGKRATGRRRG